MVLRHQSRGLAEAQKHPRVGAGAASSAVPGRFDRRGRCSRALWPRLGTGPTDGLPQPKAWADTWATLWSCLGHVGVTLGIMFGSLGGHIGVTLSSLSGHFEVTVGSLRRHFGVTSG